ncbi:hypothetical protein F5148DRAFT_1291378 [Russula earlei]|uniref:Uncharacterized protein n=1 Tax=Russula earlei TaxID=71964 RepID=A0ACC0TVK2_9AGAM|nr:hypothetical protein F5148DRAFT_1291378 [Russula earlei]
MRKCYTSINGILFLLLSLAFVNNGWAQTTIASWGFEGLTYSTSGFTIVGAAILTGSTTADAGTQTSSSAFSAAHAGSATVWSGPAGNGSTHSLSSNTWAGGDYYQFQVKTTGYSGISITWDQTGSATGPLSFKLQYSTDGTNFTDAPSTIANYTYNLVATGVIVPISWSAGTAVTTTTKTADFSSITALNNATSVYFRLTLLSTSTAINGGTIAAGGTDRVDNFIVAGATVLPISLSSFNASLVSGKTNLNWTVAQEINASGYSVERSSDATSFSEIGFVSATNAGSYSYTDAAPLTGPNYYRLKLVDKDGTFKYSNVVSVITGKSTTAVMGVYPNPVISTFTLTHPLAGYNATIRIVSIDGKNILSQVAGIGATQSTVDVSRLVKGTYIVVFENNGTKSTTQFMK